MADVPEVAVAAVDFRSAGGDFDATSGGVVEAVLAGLEGPLAPGGDNFQLRR